jgi:ABC-type multidrug transport system fused ATPase/permease subunit
MEQKQDSKQEIMTFLRKLAVYLRPHRWRITVMYTFALLNVGSLILIPVFIQRAVDLGIVPKDMDSLLFYSILVGVSALLQYLSFRIQGRQMMKIGNLVLHDLRKDLFEKIQHLSIYYFDTHKSGTLMTRLTSDVLVLEELLMAGLDTVIVDVLMISGLIAAMIFLSPYLSLVLLFVIPVLAIIVFLLRNYIMNAAGGIQKELSGVNSFLNESLSGIKVIQAFAREQRNIADFQKLNAGYYASSRKFYPLHAFFWQSVASLNTISQGLVILLGGILLHAQLISLGVIVAFLSYITRLFQPMQKISNMLNQLSRAIVSGKRIFEILDEDIQVKDRDRALSAFELRGRVEFNDVEFSYKPGEKVLKGISFSVPEGKMCAIVGHTGSGKSTTISLINRFYDVDSGELLIDGKNIKAYAQKSLRSQMSTVMQEPQIFSGTVEENIRFGKPDADISEIIQAAKTLGIHEMIESFPRGYQSELGQNGNNISLGQKQLIAFARALIRRPRILILDEASAYLDSETEAMIQKAMVPLMEGRTSFVIAHRLSTIRHADLILVLEEGKIVERGTHEELLKNASVYASYVKNLDSVENE